MKNKILIVDDEEMMTDLLSSYFSDNGYITYVANNSERALDFIEKNPDIILLDINMPGRDGLELCKLIREQVMCPIIFLTARVSEQDKIKGFRIGGDDYITKPFSLLELSARVEAHLRREQRKRNASEIIERDGLIVNVTEKTIMYEKQYINFSRREFAIIEFLISNPKQVFEREQIYERVWGYDVEGDSIVIKEHIRKIRAKLKEITGKEYIATVWGIGYKWEKE